MWEEKRASLEYLYIERERESHIPDGHISRMQVRSIKDESDDGDRMLLGTSSIIMTYNSSLSFSSFYRYLQNEQR
jgi:hypothetical protein